MVKRFVYKIYSNADEYITTWSKDVITTPAFSYDINGIAGELNIGLARKIDNFQEGIEVTLGNRVELWELGVDNNYDGGNKIYSGYISAYEQNLDDVSEKISVTCLGAGYDMSRLILQTNSGVTSITYSGIDVGVIVRDIMDKYIALGGKVTYTTTSVPVTGTTATYTFRVQTVMDALRTAVNLLDESWFFVIKPDGILYLTQTNTATADHKILIGKHAVRLNARKTLESLANEIYVIGGDLGATSFYSKYSNNDSVANYGRAAKIINDSKVISAATGQALADKELGLYSEPLTRVTITIYDDAYLGAKGYDIESVKVGDSLQLTNINFGSRVNSLWDSSIWDSSVWDSSITGSLAQVLQIKSVSYEADYITLEAADRNPELARDVFAVSEGVQDLFAQNVPSSPS